MYCSVQLGTGEYEAPTHSVKKEIFFMKINLRMSSIYCYNTC